MQLSEILYQKTNDDLKELTKLLDDCRGATRKDDLVRCIGQILLVPASLRQLWQQLDPLAQKAVAAAYHNDGEFNPTAFVAQYGQLPARPQSRYFWRPEPILLDLFIYGSQLPSDLMPLLESLVPPPDKFQLQGLADAPQVTRLPDERTVELLCAETEETGWHDLIAYLHLVGQEKLKFSYTGKITLHSLKKLAGNLLTADFFPLPEKFKADETMRPFGLDIFAKGSDLVSYGSLTETGQAFYQTQDPEILLEAFETWTQHSDFDELSRISVLKGQKSKQTLLTPPATRREAVIEALSWCPAGEWIDIQEFYRALKIWHFDFAVESTLYSNLYIGYKDHGMLYGDTYWTLVKGLYINVILWEYLGSIGALDLLYIRPEEAELSTYLDLDYYDPCLSLYDGLKYFRINKLGAYLLGQAGEYVSAKPLDRALFAVLPDKRLTIIEPEELTPYNQSQLDLLTEPLEDGVYRLDTQKVLAFIEAGNNWDQLADFLSSRHSGPLPDEIWAWLEKLQHNSQRFKKGAEALFIRVASTELADMALDDPVLKKFCKRVDPKTLVIQANRENTLRQRLKELEYLLT